MKAFYAGIVIGLGAAANLAVGGGILGAAIFSFALLLICAQGYDLFTGKVGATILGEYPLIKLAQAYFLNAAGILLVVGIMCFSPLDMTILKGAKDITALRCANSWYVNYLMGIICGMCVQLSIGGWRETKQPLVVMMPVVVFVMLKTNHCIADMFYLWYSGTLGLEQLAWTTFGNVTGSALLVAGTWWYQVRNSRNLPHLSYNTGQTSKDTQLDKSPQ